MAKKFRDLIKDISKETKSKDGVEVSNIEAESGEAMDSLAKSSKDFLKLHSVETEKYPSDEDAFNYAKIKKALDYDINKRMKPSDKKSPILDKYPALFPVKESTQKHKSKHKKHECKKCHGTGMINSFTCDDCDGTGLENEEINTNPSFNSIGTTTGGI